MGVQYDPPDARAIKQSLDALENFEKLTAKKGGSAPVMKLEGDGSKRHLECINVDKLSWVDQKLLKVKMTFSKENFDFAQILAYLTKLPTSVKSATLEKMKARLQSEVAASSPKTAKVYEKTMSPLQRDIASFITQMPELITSDKELGKLKQRLAELEKRGKDEPGIALARQMLEELEQAAKPTKPLPIPPDVTRPIYKKPEEPVADLASFIDKLLNPGKKNVDVLKLELAQLQRRYPNSPGLEIAKDMIASLEATQPTAPSKPIAQVPSVANVGHGIFNAGNSCYLNATMQALKACVPFREYLTSTPVTAPDTPLAKAFLEINKAPADVIEQFWKGMFLLQLEPEEVRHAFIENNASRFGIPKNQLLAMKDDLYTFSTLSEEQKKPYIKAALHDALLRLYEDLETKPGAASRSTSEYLRLMAIAGGFGQNTIALYAYHAPEKQEDAAEFCMQLLNILDFPGFVSYTDIAYKKEALGFPVLSLENRDRQPTKVLTLPIDNVKDGNSIQKFFDPLAVQDKIELWDNTTADIPFTPEESQRQIAAFNAALTKAHAEAKTDRERDAISQALEIVKRESDIKALAKALMGLDAEVKKVIQKAITNPTLETTHTRQLQDPPPALLPISLSRFDYNFKQMQSVKLDKALHPPEVLTMHIAGQPTKRAQYKLASTVVHTGGKSADSGHYTAFTRQGERTVHYDDNHVTAMPAQAANHIVSHNGYLLFYTFTGYVEEKNVAPLAAKKQRDANA